MSKSFAKATSDGAGDALVSLAVGTVTASVSMLVMLYVRFVPSTRASLAAAVAAGIGIWAALGSAAARAWIGERGSSANAARGYVLLLGAGATSVAFAQAGWARRDSWSAADQEMSIFPAWWVRTVDALVYTMSGTMVTLLILGALLAAFALPLSIAILAKATRGESALAMTAGFYAVLTSLVLLRHDWLAGAVYPVHEVDQIVFAKRAAFVAAVVGACLSFASVALTSRRRGLRASLRTRCARESALRASP